jgi:hypothetical protein
MDYKKSIIKTICVTILVMIILTIVTGTILVFVFTHQCANFMYYIGCNNIASVLYYKAYEDKGDIYDCYKALNIEISLGKNENIIKYYEDFVGDENYSGFMSSKLENCEKLDISVLEKSAILNDENYLVNAYVNALVACDQFDKAKEIALANFVGNNNFTFKNQGVYALGQIVDEKDWDFFNTTHTGYDRVLVVVMQDYLNRIINLFDSNKVVSSNVDKSYLVALGNRIVDVGQDINAIYSALDIKEEQIAENMSKMLIVNNVIKGII